MQLHELKGSALVAEYNRVAAIVGAPDIKGWKRKADELRDKIREMARQAEALKETGKDLDALAMLSSRIHEQDNHNGQLADDANGYAALSIETDKFIQEPFVGVPLEVRVGPNVASATSPEPEAKEDRRRKRKPRGEGPTIPKMPVIKDEAMRLLQHVHYWEDKSLDPDFKTNRHALPDAIPERKRGSVGLDYVTVAAKVRIWFASEAERYAMERMNAGERTPEEVEATVAVLNERFAKKIENDTRNTKDTQRKAKAREEAAIAARIEELGGLPVYRNPERPDLERLVAACARCHISMACLRWYSVRAREEARGFEGVRLARRRPKAKDRPDTTDEINEPRVQ